MRVLQVLDPSQGARALRDMRLFVARVGGEGKEAEDSEFEELEGLRFDTSGEGGKRDKGVGFEELLPVLSSCKWRDSFLIWLFLPMLGKLIFLTSCLGLNRFMG